MTDLTKLEREVEERRARLDSSLDRLQRRLSPTGLTNDILGIFGRAGVHPELRAGENPLPMLLLGVGLAWLLWRSGVDIGKPGRELETEAAEAAADEHYQPAPL
jgi:hypothetical protein